MLTPPTVFLLGGAVPWLSFLPPKVFLLILFTPIVFLLVSFFSVFNLDDTLLPLDLSKGFLLKFVVDFVFVKVLFLSLIFFIAVFLLVLWPAFEGTSFFLFLRASSAFFAANFFFSSNLSFSIFCSLSFINDDIFFVKPSYDVFISFREASSSLFFFSNLVNLSPNAFLMRSCNISLLIIF